VVLTIFKGEKQMARLDRETVSDSFLDEDENSLDLRKKNQDNQFL
jgi:hypothetical protein